MHADTLYHRMLEQEAAIEAAKAEGRPVPAFPPLVTEPITPASGACQIEPSDRLCAAFHEEADLYIAFGAGEEQAATR